MYCSKCEEYFCEECEKTLHNKVLASHAKYVTRDFSHASPVPQEPEKCPAHINHFLDTFCPAHYVLCCLRCSLGKDGAHKGCPVVPFDEEDSLKAVHSNLDADVAALKRKGRGDGRAHCGSSEKETGRQRLGLCSTRSEMS